MILIPLLLFGAAVIAVENILLWGGIALAVLGIAYWALPEGW